MWEDEGFTFHMIHHSFFDIMTLTAKDVHPFFYYFIAKTCTMPFMNLFTQIRVLRFVSILPYFILLLVGHISIRKRFSNTTALLFMFSIVTMPILINNMEQIRMYGWAMLFVTLMFLKLVYIYKNINRNSINSFLMVTLFSLLASYTHYYALITVALIFLIFMLAFYISKKKLKYLFMSIVLSIILYLPWIGVLLRQTRTVSNKYWIPALNIRYLIGLIDNLFISNINSKIYKLLINRFVFTLTVIIILSVLIYLIKQSTNFNVDLLIIIFGILLPFILLIVCAIISKIIGQNILLSRYIIVAMGIFWLSISILFSIFIKSHNINIIVKIILLLFILLLGTKSYYFNVISIKNMSKQFNNTTLVQFRKIPNYANVIYNDSSSMYSSASYLKHNYVLGYENNDMLYPVFHKVYGKDINKIDNIQFRLKEPTYFIEANKSIKNDNSSMSKLNMKFLYKYNHHMKKLGNINLPNDGGIFILYKLE